MSLKKKITAAIILILVYFMVGHVLIHHVAENSLRYGISRFLFEVFLALIALYIIKTTKLVLTSPQHRHWGSYLVVLILIVLISFVQNIPEDIVLTFQYSLPQQINFLLIALAAGIFEEVYCRGLLFNIFLQLISKRQNNLVLAAIYNSGIFALLHFSNYFFHHQNLQVTLQQIVYATAIGTLFSLIRVLANGLTLPIIIHALIDFTPNITGNSSGGSWLVVLIFSGLLFIPSIIILAKLGKTC
ncbi:CPBP family intramembrane glutamic endopeptidase [Bombilactobacillus thymidiniphilus]|uniref:CPBP family intramembrane metalloprotease n=1 Tax=Bombilactobacillus thymidiniphilus TaxID=2923363 RepID=A0ABY4PE92_9LACO|nr:CPBP family intramembrane glutamic endopeptidase [Bombilactobacillus thymidiniphilus]UQS83592.1 CPBP family intramembrane metalloprotease [Bombilactobacillus thymidiniphilus]UQS83655.1 CPBP family intramembrane metalloprotease [Bombilactobacillus thymidiniphilus]